MIDWLHMSTAPLDASPVLVVYRCPLTGKLETQPAWYDDGEDSDGVQVDEPGWWAFDQQSTEQVTPLAWAHYPVPDEAAWAKLGNPQVAA